MHIKVCPVSSITLMTIIEAKIAQNGKGQNAQLYLRYRDSN